MRKAIHLAILILLAAIIGAGGAWLFYTQWYIVDSQQATIRFQVMEGSYIGFNTSTEELTFGKVSRGSGAERKAILQSYVPSRAHITISGTDWVAADRTVVDLDPGSVEPVFFTLEVPADAAPGNYTGKVMIVYTRR